MFDEKSITPGLSELGYVRLKRLAYKASWNSIDVEHFLFASLFGGGNYFVCDFGIRNPGAEQFGLECLKLFGGPLFHDVRNSRRAGCLLGATAGGDNQRASIDAATIFDANRWEHFPWWDGEDTVSQCISGESIALRKLGFGEAPSDGEFFLSRISRRTGKRNLKAWSYGHGAVMRRAGPRAALDANKPVERHLDGSGG